MRLVSPIQRWLSAPSPEWSNWRHPSPLRGWLGSRARSGQIERYARLMDLLVDAVRTRNATIEEIFCEVLNTLPCPLARTIERHGLGSFRVTQKADLENPADVYRSENALPEDWIMGGNHDTPPIW